jgi:hypothetical protein
MNPNRTGREQPPPPLVVSVPVQEVQPWRLPPIWRPIKRWKARAHIWQWGKYTRKRPGNPAWNEPKYVEYTDYRNYIRFWPNPGFKIGRWRFR